MKAKDFKKMIANIPDEMNVEFMAKNKENTELFNLNMKDFSINDKNIILYFESMLIDKIEIRK